MPLIYCICSCVAHWNKRIAGFACVIQIQQNENNRNELLVFAVKNICAYRHREDISFV